MPRYFFHTCTQERLIRDEIGLELPEIARSEDPELTLALWSEVFDRQFRRGTDFVITAEIGKVLFVTAQ